MSVNHSSFATTITLTLSTGELLFNSINYSKNNRKNIKPQLLLTLLPVILVIFTNYKLIEIILHILANNNV